MLIDAVDDLFGHPYPTALRILSAALALASVAMTMLWLRPRGAATSLAAGLLLAVSPRFAEFGAEIRQYMLLVCLTVGAFFAASRFAATSSRRFLLWTGGCLALAVFGGFAPNPPCSMSADAPRRASLNALAQSKMIAIACQLVATLRGCRKAAVSRRMVQKGRVSR